MATALARKFEDDESGSGIIDKDPQFNARLVQLEFEMDDQQVAINASSERIGDGQRILFGDPEPRAIPVAAPEPEVSREVVNYWEGEVIELAGDHFVARLRDISGPFPDELADFPIEDIPRDDRALLKLGALFTWSIVRQTFKHGQIQRASDFRMRRMPIWNKQHLESGRKWGETLSEAMKTHDHDPR